MNVDDNINNEQNSLIGYYDKFFIEQNNKKVHSINNNNINNNIINDEYEFNI